MLDPDCLEQESHIAKWRRLASGEEHAGFAVYASSGPAVLWHNLLSGDYLRGCAVACSLSLLTSTWALNMTVDRPQLPRWMRPRACSYTSGETKEGPTQRHPSTQQTGPMQADKPACRVGKRKRQLDHQPYECDLQRCVTIRRTHKSRKGLAVRAPQLPWMHATWTAAVTGLANLG